MRDAFGGILNIVLIALFLVIVEGVLGFTVNYTKAFKMKNIVISSIEEYEASGCFNTSGDTSCRNKIIEGAKNVGYSPSNLSCPNLYTSIDNLFCYKANPEGTSADGKTVYRVVTQVDINIPIIKNIMGLSFFQVTGDTRGIRLQRR